MKNAIKYIILNAFLVGAFAAAVFGQTLPEGEWRLVAYDFTGKVTYPVVGMKVTLNIHADGNLGGNSGCNVFGGNHAVEDGKLKITDIISTMRACEEPTPGFERQFFDTLAAADSFTLVQGTLTLTDPKTKNFLRFIEVKKPAPNKC